MKTHTVVDCKPMVELSQINLGIVCPMANEEATAVSFVNSVLHQCNSRVFRAISFFAILDHASKDKTRELLIDLAKRQAQLHVVWAAENTCVAGAYVRGYQEALNAGCDWILEIDCGFSHQPADLPQFFDKMLEGHQCVFGSRFCSAGKISNSSLKRYLISRGGTVLTNLLLGTTLKDMTGGFELFSRAALENALRKGIQSRGPFFQTEIKAHCRNLKVIEVPINYCGASHNIDLAVMNDTFSNLWRLFRLRLRGEL